MAGGNVKLVVGYMYLLPELDFFIGRRGLMDGIVLKTKTLNECSKE